jgi:DNA repair protein RadA/Sms
VDKHYCFAAEVGLAGEIRPVNRVDQRIQEAEKLGFSTIFVSKYCKSALKNTQIEVRKVGKIEEIVNALFG